MTADKIPDEIMREARKIAECNLKAGTLGCDILEGSIARALLARDKRAADIAQDEQHRREGLYAENGASINAHRAAAADAIATAILTYDGGRDEQH